MQAYVLSLHTPSSPRMGSKVKTIYSLKVVMLHIKLKVMEHRASWKHIFCPYTHPQPSSHVAFQTRTHWMAHHRKSPCARRNLMVFDLLTLSQGHQFDPRVKFFSVSWPPGHHFNLICHMTMSRELNFDPHHPQVPPLGHDPGYLIEIPSNMFYIFLLREDTQR